jgi:hypothetical protein
VEIENFIEWVHKVNITTDMWTLCKKVLYMVIICHFIDSNWRLNRRVLKFCNVPLPHTVFVIADALHKCFQDWGN